MPVPGNRRWKSSTSNQNKSQRGRGAGLQTPRKVWFPQKTSNMSIKAATSETECASPCRTPMVRYSQGSPRSRDASIIPEAVSRPPAMMTALWENLKVSTLATGAEEKMKAQNYKTSIVQKTQLRSLELKPHLYLRGGTWRWWWRWPRRPCCSGRRSASGSPGRRRRSSWGQRGWGPWWKRRRWPPPSRSRHRGGRLSWTTSSVTLQAAVLLGTEHVKLHENENANCTQPQAQTHSSVTDTQFSHWHTVQSLTGVNTFLQSLNPQSPEYTRRRIPWEMCENVLNVQN